MLRHPCRQVNFPGGDTPVCMCDRHYCDIFNALPDQMFTCYDGLIQIHTNKAGDRVNVTMGLFHTPNVEDIDDDEDLPEDLDMITVSIDRTTTFQTIKGYGGALTDSAASSIMALKSDVSTTYHLRHFMMK